MAKKTIAITIITNIILSTILITTLTSGNTIRGSKILYVDDDNTQGPWNGTLEHPYQYIHQANENASNHDTIYVFNGTYNETITIEKTLEIIGQHKNTTIIDGQNTRQIIHIKTDHVTIQHFTIRNSGGYTENAGVKINAENTTITNCTIYRTKTGIFINTKNNLISNCIFHTNGEGIYLNTSKNNHILNCLFIHNSLGIHLQKSTYNLISNCTAHTNGIGIYANNSAYMTITHSTLKDNNDNQGGIFLIGCYNITIKESTLRHNGVGIKTAESSNIHIKYCHFPWNTHYAIRLRDFSKNITIQYCNFSNNFRYAIYVENSDCTIHNNNFYQNHLYGLYAKSLLCNAKYNWWGSPTGPALTGLRKADRITFSPGKITYFPWLIYPVSILNHKHSDISETITLHDAHSQITLPGEDTDNDGCPNWWEEKWNYNSNIPDPHRYLDPDGDALNNIEECYTDQYGSNPFQKDIFLEFDWVKSQFPDVSNKPPRDQIEMMIERFEEHNITLHVDDGILGGGEEIPTIHELTYDIIRDIYWDYFLHNDLDNPRKGVFHYGLICDYSPGGGFAVIGWDHLDSFCLSAQLLQEGFPSYTRGRLIVAGAMHETGHGLGLIVDDFGGIDNLATANPLNKEFWLYRGYQSCMHYGKTWDVLDYSDGTHFGKDFDDWGNLDFDFFKNTHFEWPK